MPNWPVFRQLSGPDRLGLGAATRIAKNPRAARTATADAMVKPVCSHCVVGLRPERVRQKREARQIEGDPDSPVSRGRLCPKDQPACS